MSVKNTLVQDFRPSNGLDSYDSGLDLREVVSLPDYEAVAPKNTGTISRSLHRFGLDKCPICRVIYDVGTNDHLAEHSLEVFYSVVFERHFGDIQSALVFLLWKTQLKAQVLMSNLWVNGLLIKPDPKFMCGVYCRACAKFILRLQFQGFHIRTCQGNGFSDLAWFCRGCDVIFGSQAELMLHRRDHSSKPCVPSEHILDELSARAREWVDHPDLPTDAIQDGSSLDKQFPHPNTEKILQIKRVVEEVSGDSDDCQVIAELPQRKVGMNTILLQDPRLTQPHYGERVLVWPSSGQEWARTCPKPGMSYIPRDAPLKLIVFPWNQAHRLNIMDAKNPRLVWDEGSGGYSPNTLDYIKYEEDDIEESDSVELVE
ncbi:uncharacterized protein LOC131881053 [Tigriopus californicus]|nr:uncharacterized protein LOC131881053 [Tigriopus californicus]